METQKYSDADLAEFKVLLDGKLEKAKEQLDQLQDEIVDITENSTGEYGGDWIDASSINNDIEMLNTMAIRQRKYVRDLENALIRIRNKTYGVCIVTGQLIDRKRLMAVPTTTKSLTAKNAEIEKAKEDSKPKFTKLPPRVSDKPVIITKKITKTPSATRPRPIPIDDEDDDLFVDDDLDTPTPISLDDIADDTFDTDDSSLDDDDDADLVNLGGGDDGDDDDDDDF